MSTITITIDSDETSKKLKDLRQEPTSKVKDNISPKVIETMNLLRKRLERQSEHIGGSV